MFADLGKRLIIGTAAVAAALVLIYFANIGFMPWLIRSVTAILAAVAVWELIHFSNLKFQYVTPVLAGLVILSGVFQWQLLVTVAAIMLIFILYFRDIDGALEQVSLHVFSLIYIALPLLMLLQILALDRLMIVYLLVMTKGYDICAYFIGKSLGKHLLAPELSPKKTIEGAVGGLIIVSGVSMLFPFHGYVEMLILGAALAIAAQLGDLAESLLKRSAHVKDSNSVPGMGGVLDTLDSLLFTTPIVYLYLK